MFGSIPIKSLRSDPDEVLRWPGQQLGDIVSLGGKLGTVVSDIVGGQYGIAPEYSAEQWAYLGAGVMIEFESYDLIDYTKAEPDLLVVHRAGRR